jgi:cytochrome d ubiquinol oxidase subunit II
MEVFWFSTVAVMLTVYVILDGYDLGAGIVYLLLSKTEDDRRQILASIHPLWDGNEVWLIAGGTTLFFAFPRLYAVSFSGFYLPLMMVLWLLILRGIGIEYRNHIQSKVWIPFWDTVFSISSALLAIFFGAALGNVIRGVPYDLNGVFFLPLWTNFRTNHEIGILDWYTISVALAAFLTLFFHGCVWVAYRTSGQIEKRSKTLAKRLWPVLVAITLCITGMSFYVQPQIEQSFRLRPWGILFPLIAIAGALGMRYWISKNKLKASFFSSSIFILGMLTSAAFGVYPYVLPSILAPNQSLTVYNSIAPAQGLEIGLLWFVPGIILAAGYSIFVHWKFSGKVNLEEEHG